MQRTSVTRHLLATAATLAALIGGFRCKNRGRFTASDGQNWPENADDLDTGPVIGFGTPRTP